METKELLILLNEWWRTQKVGLDRLKPYYREAFTELQKLMDYQQVTIVTGLRRVGKSTLLFQLIDLLLKKEVPPSQIIYFSFDDQKEEIISILNAFQEATGTNWKQEKIYVFFDEIQKLKGWSSQLKLVYDAFSNVKFVVSGSASLQLEKEAMHNLAGRYFLQEIAPLSLKEYFELKHSVTITNYELYRTELRLELENYGQRSFPEMVSWTEERRVLEYVRETVVSKILKTDLPEIFDKVNTRLLEMLIEIFYGQPGMILNVDALSRDLKVHKMTLEFHIFLLEFSKLIRIIKNFRVSILAESRKLRKVYPAYTALLFPFNPRPEKGQIAECLVASKIEAKYYWRKGNKEVDFIVREHDILPIEVKHKESLGEEDFRNLTYFLKKFSIPKGIIVYYGSSQEGTIARVNMVDFLYQSVSL